MIVVLLIIMVSSGLFLATVYLITENRIKCRMESEKEEAILKVMPGAVNYREVEPGPPSLYLGLNQNLKPVGYAMKIEGSGFQGTITLMVGLEPEENRVTGIEILEMSETPGLGARIEEEWFKNQFIHKSFDDPFIVDKDIDTITGATISSKVVTQLVYHAVTKFNKTSHWE